MEWLYVAGLFDGEGCVAMAKDTHNVVKLKIFISASYAPTREALRSFLAQGGITTSEYSNINKFGRSHNIEIQSWDGCEKFLNSVFPYVLEKRRHLEIAKEAIKLHKRVKAEGKGAGVRRIKDFDVLRHKLHALANKGPALTKKWQ